MRTTVLNRDTNPEIQRVITHTTVLNRGTTPEIQRVIMRTTVLNCGTLLEKSPNQNLQQTINCLQFFHQ
jgi:hypothetical protein